MAQEQPKRPSKEEEQDQEAKDMVEIGTKVETNSNEGFKFNAEAPAFVPRSKTEVPVSGFFYPCFHVLGGSANSPDWLFVGDSEPPSHWISNANVSLPKNSPKKNALPDDLQHKIIKQVEYQFSDISLLANETLAKHINKDPEGYVPISVIASTKKIKSLTTNNQMLAQALRSSSKLAVSNDGKKVKRKYPFTEKGREEFQSRTVVAENLPEDHSHQNLEKIFRVAGSVKTIRVCHPQESNSSRPKGEFLISNKLHALVEYETTGAAEKAVEKLNDERNWRKGLRIRLLLRCSPKSVLKNRPSEFNGILDDDETPSSESAEDATHPSYTDSITETLREESSAGSKKGQGRGRGKGRGRGRARARALNHTRRGLVTPSPQPCNGIQGESSPTKSSKGPRMPDGTRGFTMGRGKPLKAQSSSTNAANFLT